MRETFIQRDFADFSPNTPQETQLYRDLDRVYEFMKKRDSGRSTMRYVGTPYMLNSEQSVRDGDSITDHHYGIVHWFITMQPLLPHLSAVLDHQTIYEYAALHDDPEQVTKDVPADKQLRGNYGDRAEKEANAYIEMTEDLPQVVRDHLRETYFSYTQSKGNPLTTNKEALTVKMFDTLEADCQVLFKGNGWDKFRDNHRDIIQDKFVPYARRLENLLLQQGSEEAADEVRILASHHLYQYQKKGVDFFNTFPS